MKWNGPAAVRATCRPLSAPAAARCASLHAQAFTHSWPATEFERLLTDPSVVADGVADDAAIRGFVLSRRAADEAEILTIVVEPAARQAGLATRLLSHHVARLAGLGVSSLFLEVDESNGPALALYRRLGFFQVGKRRAYYSKSDGSRANALILKLTL
ncbi:MAG TPA: ribosomal protein S18-alanine N-acetyltransferase [Rhodoblastus sp.]|nr:ribosomal protein S18-alanine N-acetyltransferase [Rhodoblastus sp.]